MNRPSSDTLASILLETGTEPDEMLDFVAHGLGQTDPFLGMDKVTHGADGRLIGLTNYRGANYSMSMTADFQPTGKDKGHLTVGVVLDPHNVGSRPMSASSFWEITPSLHMERSNRVVLKTQAAAKKLADELAVAKRNEDDRPMRKALDDVLLYFDDEFYSMT